MRPSPKYMAEIKARAAANGEQKVEFVVPKQTCSREIAFKEAHRIAKRCIKPGDDYRLTFGAALKWVYERYSVARPVRRDAVAKKLLAAGGKEWMKGEHHRVYFDVREIVARDDYSSKEWRRFNIINTFYDVKAHKFCADMTEKDVSLVLKHI